MALLLKWTKSINLISKSSAGDVWRRHVADVVERLQASIIDRMVEEGWSDEIRYNTGVLPDATYSAAKIIWILENVPEVRSLAEKGELAWGTLDTWLLWNLTEGTVHATDVSNASLLS